MITLMILIIYIMLKRTILCRINVQEAVTQLAGEFTGILNLALFTLSLLTLADSDLLAARSG